MTGLTISMHTHVDDCTLTVNVSLGKDNFKGGDLYFYGRRSELDSKVAPPRCIVDVKDTEKPYWRYKHQQGTGVSHGRLVQVNFY